MTIVLKMIDEATTSADFKRCCTLVRDHITSNVGPDENGVLVNALMLKFTAMAAQTEIGDPKAWFALFSGMARDAMRTFHTNPPQQGEWSA